jgi:hypothetical protein
MKTFLKTKPIVALLLFLILSGSGHSRQRNFNPHLSSHLLTPLEILQDRAMRRPLYTVAAFSPTDVANLKVWLKADQISLADNDPIDTWADQSGNALDVTASSTARPTYQTNELNSLPIVRFDGINDALTRSSFTNLSQPNTIFCIRKHLSTPTGHEIDGDTGAGARNLVGYLSGPVYALYAGTVLSGGTLAVDTWELTEAVFNGGSSTLHVNGASTLSGAAGAQALGGVLRIGGGDGASFFFGGDMAEVVIYNADIGSTNRGLVRAYLCSKWALTCS